MTKVKSHITQSYRYIAVAGEIALSKVDIVARASFLPLVYEPSELGMPLTNEAFME